MKKLIGLFSALAGLLAIAAVAYYVYKTYFCCNCDEDDCDECDTKEPHKRGYFNLSRFRKAASEVSETTTDI